MARQADLLAVEEAQARILAAFSRLPSERLGLEQALGRVLSDNVTSPIQIPPFANSSMDGFALLSEDVPGPGTSLHVAFQIAAGTSPPRAIERGECARIMTGAPVPPGANAVIPFEEVEDRGGSIVLSGPVAVGASIRPAGQDIPAGTVILSRGRDLRATDIGLLAATGNASVTVTRQPVVAILATGDELVPPGTPLQPGQIYNSNSPMLAAAVREAGGIASVSPPIADTPQALREALSAASDSDLILTSGGASVGDFDYVKEVLQSAGDLGFWRIRMRPGKPLLSGSVSGVPLIGLPGNPTSAMATFEQFVRPAIRTMLGAPPFRPEVDVIVDDHVDNRGGRRTFARVILTLREGRVHARLSGPQDSAMLLPLSRADGLLIVPEECQALSPGDRARAQCWDMPRAE